MKTIVISPTYNESRNIEELIEKIMSIFDDVHILVVDDNSPDGTADIVRKIMADNKRVHLLSRPKKLGLGTAYCTGFQWALEHGFDRIVQMDADMSHNPQELPKMLEASHKADIIIGSRYIKGVNWPLRRLILSYVANVYARLITGIPVKDLTGGFKCFRKEVLSAINLDQIKSEGYSFQIEMNFLSWIKGFKITEIPIIFVDRTVGESKMSRRIIFEAIWMVPKLKLKKIMGKL